MGGRVDKQTQVSGRQRTPVVRHTTDTQPISVMVGRGRGTRALGSRCVRFLPAPKDAASAAH
eukprot:6991586-Prymnesium_polylepis.1